MILLAFALFFPSFTTWRYVRGGEGRERTERRKRIQSLAGGEKCRELRIVQK